MANVIEVGARVKVRSASNRLAAPWIGRTGRVLLANPGEDVIVGHDIDNSMMPYEISDLLVIPPAFDLRM